MALKKKSTEDVTLDGVKICVYGIAGSGKTTLCATARNAIMLSAEAGLLSIKGMGRRMDYYEIQSYEDLQEAYDLVIDSEYETICLDSLTEIAERILAEEKQLQKDARQAYGIMQDKCRNLVRAFRDIKGKNVVFVCKQERIQNEQNALIYSPSVPSKALPQEIPYFFDEVFAMRIIKNPDTQESYRVVQTQPYDGYDGKDRSNKLEVWEEPDLQKILDKIKGVDNGIETTST